MTARLHREVTFGGTRIGAASVTAASFVNPQPWAEGAPCATADPEVWFPEKGGTTQSAKAVCAGCPVETKTACLEWALANNERFGVWGGLSERERRKLIKRPAVSVERRTYRQICGHCERGFDATAPTQKWCSPRCGNRGRQQARTEASAA